MRLDYIEIRTHDPEKMKHFYVGYFDAVVEETLSCLDTGEADCAYLLSFRGGFKIKLIPAEANIPLIHLAFRVGNRKRVNELTCRLLLDGHEVISEPGADGMSRYGSSVYDPDGNVIDLVS